MQSNVFDLIIIGGGPGGYVAAIRASQLGFNVACVEKKNTLGGTCLNEGCIPSKTLLNASHKYSEISNNGLNEIGVRATNVKLDLDQMMTNKNEVVTGLTNGIDQLFNKNKITRLSGHAEIKGPGQVQIKSGPDKGIFEAKRIVIATGSKPLSPQGIEIDEKTIISSSGALTLSKVPKRLLVIGAGYIGIEMATV
ncbi:MAG: Dihydrolipoyl dehydrogenase 3, partial [Alphaproteobacteria bacterium MarineAlpha3_Bin7]